MTSANDPFRVPAPEPLDPRSAACPRLARGAPAPVLPPGRPSGTAWWRVAGVLAMTLCATLALPAEAREPTGRHARRAEAATAPRHHAQQARPARHHRHARRSRHADAGPVMRDAPQELLPAADSLVLARHDLPRGPRAACLAAARRAEQVHGLPDGLLVAVAMSESGLHAHAIKVGGRALYPADAAQARDLLARAGRRASPMVGCVQVNSRVHARGSDWPLDPLRATDWAGGMLRRWHQETGDWVEALRRWHGGSARTERAVLCRVRARLEVVNPANDLLRDYPCAETVTAQGRRDGQVLLEVAAAPE